MPSPWSKTDSSMKGMFPSSGRIVYSPTSSAVDRRHTLRNRPIAVEPNTIRGRDHILCK